MKRKRGGKQHGGRTWDEYFRENKTFSTLAGTAGTLASFIPGVNMLVAPALAGVSGGLALGGYGRKRRRMMGGAVFTGGQVPIHKMTGAGVRGMVGGNRNAQAYGGNSVYNNVGSSYGSIRV